MSEGNSFSHSESRGLPPACSLCYRDLCIETDKVSKIDFYFVLGNREKTAHRLRRQIIKGGRCPLWTTIRNCSTLEQCNWDVDCSGAQRCCKSTCETRSCHEPILPIRPNEGNWVFTFKWQGTFSTPALCFVLGLIKIIITNMERSHF